MDRLAAMTTFVTIAEEGAFASAARRLRISPQAATRAINGLEASLGVRLLHRTTRSVRLTDEGAGFLARARTILADLADAEQSMKGAQSKPRGTLSITAPVIFGRMHVLPIISTLMRKHPDLSVQLLLVDRVVQIVEEGIDIAVRIGDLADSALRATQIGEVRRVLVASPAYLKTKGAPATLKDLHNHDLIAFTGLSDKNIWRFGPGGKSSIRVRPRLTVNNADAAIAAAEASLGITQALSYQVSRAVKSCRLSLVLDPHGPPSVPISLVFQAALGTTPNVRAFITAAKNNFREAIL